MHQDEGHYAGKHPAGTELNTKSAKAVKKRLKNERISCRSAHEAAAEAGVSPQETGKTLDLLEVRINGCQLGLFGHGGKNRGKAEFRMPAESDELRAAIAAAADDDGISCLNLWIAADDNGFTRIEAAAVCEADGTKIKNCQLGAF